MTPTGASSSEPPKAIANFQEFLERAKKEIEEIQKQRQKTEEKLARLKEELLESEASTPTESTENPLYNGPKEDNPLKQIDHLQEDLKKQNTRWEDLDQLYKQLQGAIDAENASLPN